MAHLTTPDTPLSNPLAGLGRAILRGLVAAAEANPRVREADRLKAMSDEDLARMGLRREDIVRHVFRDLFYV